MAWKQSRERNRRLKKRCKSPDMPFTRGVFYDEEKGRCIHYYVGSLNSILSESFEYRKKDPETRSFLDLI